MDPDADHEQFTRLTPSHIDLLGDLVAFRSRVAEKGSSRDLDGLHADLMARAGALVETGSAWEAQGVERLLAKALMSLEALAFAVERPRGTIDTAGSWSLDLFEPDYRPTPEGREMLARALEIACPLVRDALGDIRAEVARDLRHASAKHALVSAMCHIAGVGDRPDARTCLRLFEMVHPEVGFAPGEVDVVVTGTLIFFIVDFEGDRLRTRRFEALDENASGPIREFLARVSRFADPRFTNFPAFGYLTPLSIPGATVDAIADATGMAESDVALELCRIVTVLPRSKMEMYLVHDVWGHSHQASVLEFEQLYAKIASLDRVVTPTSGAGPGGSKRLSPRTTPPEAEAFLDALAGDRLWSTLGAWLAEVLADFAEYKVAARISEQNLDPTRFPSTSPLRRYPTLLDLSLRDLVDLLERVVAPLVEVGSEEGAARLAREMRSAGWTPDGATRTSEVVRDASREVLRAWRPEPAPTGPASCNMAGRLALHALSVHGALHRAHSELAALDPAPLPLGGFDDLLMMAVSVFYLEDPVKNIWRLDEYIAECAVPFCRRLVTAASG